MFHGLYFRVQSAELLKTFFCLKKRRTRYIIENGIKYIIADEKGYKHLEINERFGKPVFSYNRPYNCNRRVVYLSQTVAKPDPSLALPC